MNRQDFYLNLALELNMLKVPPELINTHIDQFKSYLQTLSEEEAEQQIASFGDVKDLAKNIYRLLCGDDHDSSAGSDAAENDTVYDAFRVDDDIVGEEKQEGQEENEPEFEIVADEVDVYAEDFDGLAQQQPVSEPAAESGFPRSSAAQLQLDFDIGDEKNYVMPDPDIFEQAKEQSKAEQAPAPIEEIFDENQLIFPIENKSGFSENNSALFWVLFVITLPITVPLFITVMSVFGFAYILAGLLTGVTFAAIFATALCGAAVTLIGGLYGITQLNTGNLAIGLFELGLSLAIAGGTILLCFIFYLLSIKLFPKLFYLLTRLLRFFLDKLITLIAKLKKECAHR